MEQLTVQIGWQNARLGWQSNTTRTSTFMVHLDSGIVEWEPYLACNASGLRRIISGLPRYSVITPWAQMWRPVYLSRLPNPARSSSQTITVKSWLGYGLSKVMNVGLPLLLAASGTPVTLPQTVAVSPTWEEASVAGTSSARTVCGAHRNSASKSVFFMWMEVWDSCRL